MTSSGNAREAFGLTILKNNHKDIRRLRQETGAAEIHGNKFWKSSFLLMDYLQESRPRQRLKILEIGCGWGLGGIFCAKHFAARVTSLDADASVFPYLLHHADINGVKVETWRSRYENVRRVDLSRFDMVIGADICFWDSMVDPLFNLVRRAHQAGVGRIVLSDPGRPTFRTVAQRCVDKLEADYQAWHVPAPHNTSGLILEV
ncbi:methyltransferase domain-containing protein [Exilibacterium tricleocarpae]|uniref:Methyltransferase domain-containing protein n=1 Tax=Exilibacterium tricleocarpae TaxID=2591008 RepID=A0A545SYR6_9GAMM|nr:methyltransferase domain-containing protein [Exilibacterium tricleocarpae]TQV70113.1 methyltransferase domain-containing protein [Exilibacterium tricleocarpae]